MRRFGLSLEGMPGYGPSFSQKDRSLAGFEELAMPLFDSLYNLARWLAKNQNDAEDLVQETYLKAWRSFASFQPDTNFRAWIFRILRNTFLGSRSKLEWRMTAAMESEEDLPSASATPESTWTPSSGPSNNCRSFFARSFCCVMSKKRPTAR
jgi:RNA polymerase sigma factor (sigma-70 family)